MTQQIALSSDAIAGFPDPDSNVHLLTTDLVYRRVGIANIMFYGEAGALDRGWVLIDAGIPGSTDMIAEAAGERFGKDSRPAAIVMTHAHFDHVGALKELAERWDAPVYAHPLELPFLNGSESYPPADPRVGGGLMALLSPLYPRGPVDVSERLYPLPHGGVVPGMPHWQWIHTPGHTPGHVSLWCEATGTLIAGDAFITTAQESAYAVLKQTPEMHGPPKYFTPDWATAGDSVRKLAALKPGLVITGHGPAMHGEQMQAALQQLADQFESVAVPG